MSNLNNDGHDNLMFPENFNVEDLNLEPLANKERDELNGRTR